MLKFEHTVTYNMWQALQAMRLPYNSESDSQQITRLLPDKDTTNILVDRIDIGPKDMELIRKLIAGGPSHRKFMRQILLSVDINAPRYWWTQFDTYKVGVTACSESTMHTLMKKPIELEDFSMPIPESWIVCMEMFRQKGDFGQLVAMLPQGYLQKRHVTMNYEAVRNIREQREGHKLHEWQEFIEWSDTLPHASLFFGGEG